MFTELVIIKDAIGAWFYDRQTCFVLCLEIMLLELLIRGLLTSRIICDIDILITKESRNCLTKRKNKKLNTYKNYTLQFSN